MFSLGQHSLELLPFILFINFVKFVCRYLAVVSFAYVCFRVADTAADFGGRDYTFPLFYKVVLFFVSGGVVPGFLEVCFSSQSDLQLRQSCNQYSLTAN